MTPPNPRFFFFVLSNNSRNFFFFISLKISGYIWKFLDIWKSQNIFKIPSSFTNSWIYLKFSWIYLIFLDLFLNSCIYLKIFVLILNSLDLYDFLDLYKIPGFIFFLDLYAFSWIYMIFLELYDFPGFIRFSWIYFFLDLFFSWIYFFWHFPGFI